MTVRAGLRCMEDGIADVESGIRRIIKSRGLENGYEGLTNLQHESNSVALSALLMISQIKDLNEKLALADTYLEENPYEQE